MDFERGAARLSQFSLGAQGYLVRRVGCPRRIIQEERFSRFCSLLAFNKADCFIGYLIIQMAAIRGYVRIVFNQIWLVLIGSRA